VAWKLWDKPQPQTRELPAEPVQADGAQREWAWKAEPGAHERQLQRRCNNLLFPAARRVVTGADVDDARRKDAAELKDLMQKVGAINLPEDFPNNWNECLSNIREEIDGLKKRTRQIGGDTTKLMDHLNATRSDMMNIWRECMKNNPEGLRLFEIAEAKATEYDQESRGDFGEQLLRDDPCIPAGELAPSLLCEDSRTVAAFWAILPDANKKIFDKLVADCIHAATAEGFEIGTVREQLLAMGWPRSPAA
jgi:hypothetical protein